MAASIRNAVLAQLGTDLLAMTIAGGYSRNVTRVVRRAPYAPDLTNVTTPDMTVFLWTEPEVKDVDDALGQVRNTVTVNVAGLVLDDPDQVDATGGEIVADFEQCVATPNGRVIAGATVDIVCTGDEVLNQSPVPSVAGGSATFQVTYFTPQGQPRVAG